LSSDTESGDGDDEHSVTLGIDVAISFQRHNLNRLDRETRDVCLDALRRIRNKLAKRFTKGRNNRSSCKVIEARVPIVKLELPAFEVDVAIEGCNGADTSTFAATQVARFRR
jgi:hypothetical protein